MRVKVRFEGTLEISDGAALQVMFDEVFRDSAFLDMFVWGDERGTVTLPDNDGPSDFTLSIEPA